MPISTLCLDIKEITAGTTHGHYRHYMHYTRALRALRTASQALQALHTGTTGTTGTTTYQRNSMALPREYWLSRSLSTLCMGVTPMPPLHTRGGREVTWGHMGVIC